MATNSFSVLEITAHLYIKCKDSPYLSILFIMEF